LAAERLVLVAEAVADFTHRDTVGVHPGDRADHSDPAHVDPRDAVRRPVDDNGRVLLDAGAHRIVQGPQLHQMAVRRRLTPGGVEGTVVLRDVRDGMYPVNHLDGDPGALRQAPHLLLVTLGDVRLHLRV